jgi:hypothetical protein
MFLFTMTSAPLTQNQDQLTLLSEDFPAKTSAKPERVPAWLAADRACSTNCSESFAWWDRATSCWKTSQRSLTEGWTTFLERWPRQGLMRNGHVFRQRLWVPVISATGGGALPTPKASDGERGRDNARARPDAKGRELATVVRDQMLPTPNAGLFNDGESPDSWMARRKRIKAKGINGNGMGMPLSIAAQLLTPTANDWKGRTNWEAAERHGPQRLPDCLPTGKATYLNPSFVEEMMGFPIGWTA